MKIPSTGILLTLFHGRIAFYIGPRNPDPLPSRALHFTQCMITILSLGSAWLMLIKRKQN